MMSLEALSQINEHFEACPMQQMAFDSLCGEILRPPLEWANAAGGIAPHVRAVPRDVDLAIIAAVKGVLVAGAFFWKPRPGSVVPTVSHPTLVWHGKRGWTPETVWEPFPATYRADRVNSPSARALESSLRLKEHENLLLNRDRLNSKPSVFITVDKRIQNNDGHARPWFRSIGRDFVDSISEEISGNDSASLDRLIADRAEVVKNLGNKTIRQERGAGEGELHDADVDTKSKYHREHVVQDGYEAQPAPVLNSLVDGLQHTIKLENRVLYAMSVPPVAVGRNVNSERMASAPQLVMQSVRAYHTFVERIRGAINEMLAAASTDKDSDEHIRFAAQLDNYDLDRLEGIMTPEASAAAYASTFRIPQEWISLDALRIRQGALHGAQKTTEGHEAAIRQVKRSRGPPPKSNDTV